MNIVSSLSKLGSEMSKEEQIEILKQMNKEMLE